jgi:hypothetical protein
MFLEGMPLTPPAGIPFCDIRDVSALHIKALEAPEGGGRYIVCPESLLMTEVAAMLKEKMGDRWARTCFRPRSGPRPHRLTICSSSNPPERRVSRGGDAARSEARADLRGQPTGLGRASSSTCIFLFSSTDRFARYNVKTRSPPWFLLKMASFFDSGAASMMPLWKLKREFDCSASTALLGRDLMPAPEAILAMAESIDQFDLAKKK